MLYFYIGFLCYIIFISIVAIVAVIKDKRASQQQGWRIKEKTLLIIAMLGGSVAMLITMQKYRHKTKHAKFMIGIPFIIFLQIALIVCAIYLVWRQKESLDFLLIK